MISGNEHGTRRRIKWWLMAVIAAIALCPPARAASPPSITAGQQFGFAQSLFRDAHYVEASMAFRRFLYLYPEDPRHEEAMYMIGRSLQSAGRYDDAIKALEKTVDRYRDSDFAQRAMLDIGECHRRMARYGEAMIALNNLLTLTDDPAIRDEVHYRLGWIQVELWDLAAARRQFNRIQSRRRDHYRIGDIMARLDDAGRLPMKNPRIAGMLSIIPGGGQVYNERYRDALVAFVVNTGLILAAVEAFDNGNEALGGVISFVEVGFYGGNIYGAVSGAHKYNRRRKNRFIESMKQHLKLRLSATDGESVRICLQFPF